MRRWLVILGVGASALWGIDHLLPEDAPPDSAPTSPPPAQKPPAPAVEPLGPVAAPAVAKLGTYADGTSGSGARASAAASSDVDRIAAEAESSCAQGECACLGLSERIRRVGLSRLARSLAANPDSPTARPATAVQAGDRAATDATAAAAAAGARTAVSGDVADARGGALPGARVMLLDASGGRFDARTDASGRFSFGSLPSGNYVAVAEDEGWLPMHAEVQEGAPVHLTLRAPLRLGGRVLQGRRAAAGAEVELTLAGCRRTATVGGDGAFAFEGLTPGSYVLTARAGSRTARRTVDLGATADERLPEKSIDLELR